ncbi:IS5 family transposase OS=Streptomyces tendae OX=1932 GN=F3L20_33105 PE=4 SV=1 [Streptomyces tendae]
MTDLVERLVPDELWVLFRRVVAPTVVIVRRAAADGGRVTARPWPPSSSWRRRAVPGGSCRRCSARPGPTVYRRFAQWTRERVWARLYRMILDELGARGELDWSRCAIDSVSLRAAKRGCLTGPNPTDRGKLGSEDRPDLRPANGLPLSLGVSGANMHDSQGLEPLVRGIPPIRSRRGPRRRKPAKLHADKGYDYDHLRRWLRRARHPPPHCPQGHRVLTAAGPAPLGGGENRVLAGWLPPASPPL